MRKITSLLFFCILSLFSCKNNANQITYGNYIKFSNILYGINWSVVKVHDIIPILQQKNISFKCYDWDTGKEFTWSGSKKDIKRIGKIETNYFIGSELDASHIDKVEYACIYPYMSFQISITMKNEYYDIVLESLNKKFGEKNSYVNLKGFDEVGWYASTKDIMPTDVICVELSKRQAANEALQESVNRSACILIIKTAGIDMETEFRKRNKKEEE